VPGIRHVVVLPALLVLAFLPSSSDPSGTHSLLRPYLPVSAHQAYGFSLAHGNSIRSDHGLDWVSGSEQALFDPEIVATPFERDGLFDSAEIAALGYRFTAESGRKIDIEVALETSAGGTAELFVDLFRVGALWPELVASAPPGSVSAPGRQIRSIELDLLQDAEYVLRVQPDLRSSGEFSVAIRSEPTLAFPVEGFGTRAIQSGFGAVRDGGARDHHGVDIFAPRGTLAIAAVDARVSRVETTGRGGNVVWLKPLFGNLRLYYAHLDTQAVKPGQYILAGETIGTVGNTGNARTTPPHLHFGVYIRGRGGAWDPYPFLK